MLVCCTLGEEHNSSVSYWQWNKDVKLQALFFHFNNTICCVFHLRELTTVSELFAESVKTAREGGMVFFSLAKHHMLMFFVPLRKFLCVTLQER